MPSNDTVQSIALHGQLLALYERARSAKESERKDIFADLDAVARQVEGARTAPETRSAIRRYARLVHLSLEERAGADSPGVEPGRSPSAGAWPIVVTSINPFGRTDVQLACFEQWQRLGHSVYTFNHQSEAAAVKALGIDDGAIVELGDAETGLEVHGKPVPRILSVLDRAVVMFGRDILLVNSDLLADARAGVFVEPWQAEKRPIGLVREDELSNEVQIRSLTRSYTNGIDGFFLPRQVAMDICERLKLFEAARRMCFGMIGWDFAMGAAVLEAGGTIRRCPTLVHEYHKPTYSDVSEFAHYVSLMETMGLEVGSSEHHAAANFARLIDEKCSAAGNAVAIDRFRPTGERSLLGARGREVLDAMERLCLDFVVAFGRECTVALIHALDRRRDISLADILVLLSRCEPKSIFGLCLFISVTRLHLGAQKADEFTLSYPRTSQHSAALTAIRHAHGEDRDGLRRAVVQLFLVELDEYGIFNPRLFNYLALCCENDAERALLGELLRLVKKELPDVA